MKKCLCLCIALMLSTTAWAAPLIAGYSVGDDQARYCIMLDENGTLFTPTDTYSNIFCITLSSDADAPRLYAASLAVLESIPDGKDDYDDYGYTNPIALMSENGKLLTGFDYSAFQHHPEENVVIFTGLSGLQGVMDASGNIIHPDRYLGIVPNGRGGYLAIPAPDGNVYDYNTSYPIVYIDEKGRVFKTGHECAAFGLTAFSEGFCAVTTVYGSGDGGFYLDFEGSNVFRRTYGWTEPFYGNFSVARDPETDLVGLIDKTGAWVLPPEFDTIDSGSYHDTGIYLACTDAEAILTDAYTLETLGRIEFPVPGSSYAWYSSPFFINVSTENTSSIYDLQGNLLIDNASAFDMWYPFADTVPERAVLISGDWPDFEYLLTDLSGNVVGPVFQSLTAASWQNGQGRYIYTTFDKRPGEDGLYYPDWPTYRYGLCDQDGNILLDAQYTALDAISPDRYWARLATRSGLIDETGKWYFAIDDYAYLMD